MNELEEAVIDYRLVGYSLKGSLMKPLRMEVSYLPGITSRHLKKIRRNSTVCCAGILLVDQRPPAAKGFGFMTLEDEYGTIDLVLKPDIYVQHKSTFRSSRFLIVTGKLQRLDDHVTILVEKLESFAQREILRSHNPHPRMFTHLEW